MFGILSSIGTWLLMVSNAAEAFACECAKTNFQWQPALLHALGVLENFSMAVATKPA
jgi:hypothetical protein